MIPASFRYRRATSVEEAVAMLREADGEGRLLAGGHSLIPLMKLRFSEPGVLIDIMRIPGLTGVREVDGGIEIGATTTQVAVEESDLLRERAPMLAEAAEGIGDPQVRNRGTLGGSLAHADPAADMPAVMVALDAEFAIAGPGGQRSVRAGDFFQDVFTVDLAEDEMLTSIRFAPLRTASYAKLRQKASHFAIVGVAAALNLEDGLCRSARVAITGLSTHAFRLPAVEEGLRGRRLDADTIAAAARDAAAGVEQINDDLFASETYRAAMAEVFVRRAVTAAAGRV